MTTDHPTPSADDEALDAAVREACAILALAISDALGPVRPVSGTSARGGRRATHLLLRAINRAGAALAGPDAQRAYDNLAASEPKAYERPCAACGAEPGESCRIDCIGLAAHTEQQQTVCGDDDCTIRGHQRGDELIDERDPSSSVRAISAGLPTLGRGRR